MLLHPRFSELFLLEPGDLCDGCLPAAALDAHGALDEIVSWAKTYLCNPHPELGRDGPVCPYVQGSMRKRAFYLTVYPGADLSPEDVEQRLAILRDWFQELSPSEGSQRIFQTVLCLFPDLSRDAVRITIDAVQDRLKPSYVEQGLMLGEFHDGPPDKAGLWNPDFRPLSAPIPMLVVRNMVATDFAFLKDDRDMMRHYLSRFGADLPAHLRADVAEAARRWQLPHAGQMPHVHRRVRRALERAGVQARVRRHQDFQQEITCPWRLAQALGYDLDRLTKTLFLRTRQNRYVVAIAPVAHQVDLAGLAQRAGIGRLELANPEELAAYLDYSPGGVSPLGVDSEIPIFMDDSLLGWPTVLVAAGEQAVELELAPEDLRRATDATLLPLAEVAVPAPSTAAVATA
ncbi:MAG: YbaK/EbsC family protein [Acidobacteriota bacterium]